VDVQDSPWEGPDHGRGNEPEISSEEDHLDIVLSEKSQRLLPHLLRGSSLRRDDLRGDTGPPSPLQSSGIGPITDEKPNPTGASRGLVVQEGLEVAAAARGEDCHRYTQGCLLGSLSG